MIRKAHVVIVDLSGEWVFALRNHPPVKVKTDVLGDKMTEIFLCGSRVGFVEERRINEILFLADRFDQGGPGTWKGVQKSDPGFGW